MLYTGKGDGGTTKAFDSAPGVRISKASELPEALGSLDELNAFIGLVKVRAAKEKGIAKILREVQEGLFMVQAEVAGADKRVGKERVEQIETIVNSIEKEIPKLKGFSIAGGTELSALLDVSRTLARRAERRIVGVAEAGLRDLAPETRSFMNRLSSLLFALARYANYLEGVPEENPHY